MEFSSLLFILGAVAIIWVVVAINRMQGELAALLKRLAKSESEGLKTQERVRQLEQQVLDLQKAPKPLEPRPPTPVEIPQKKAIPKVESTIQQHSTPPVPPVPIDLRIEATVQKEPAPPPQPRSPVTASASAPVAPTPSKNQRKKTLFDLEEALGTNWLLKIGMAILVVGISLFLAYSVQKLGPMGKVLTGFGVSVVAIVGGRIMERRRQYEIFGRVVLSGGWALAYFTSFAMGHIPAARVLSSDLAATLAMLAVAAAMVVESLKYRSQFVTAFAYGLAYLTLVINPADWHTLLAGFLLSASVVVVLRKLQWYALESLAIAGTYLNHFMWVYGKRPVPDYAWSVSLLAAYWTMFTVSHFLRRGRNASEERLLYLALILNAGAYLGVSAYQAQHPELAFAFLLTLGLAYLGLSALSHRLNRPGSYRLMSTIGAVLTMTAAPYKFTGNNLSLFWLAECEILLVAGYRVRELHLRRLAWLASATLALYVVITLIGKSLVYGFNPASKAIEGFVVVWIGLVFMLDALVIARLYRSEVKPPDTAGFKAFLYCGWFFVIAAAWFLTPPTWLALVWIAIGFLLFEGCRRLRETDLARLAHASVLLGAARIVSSLPDHFTGGRGISVETEILLGAALSLQLFSENSRRETTTSSMLIRSYSVASWALMMIAAWMILPSPWTALTWLVLGFLWFEASIRLDEAHLRYLGHAAVFVGFLRALFVNLDYQAAHRLWNVEAGILIAISLLLYLFSENLRRSPSGDDQPAFIVQSYLGTVLLFATICIIVPWIWPALILALGSWLLHGIGVALGEKHFRIQAQLLAVTSAVTAIRLNLGEEGAVFGWSQQVVIGGATALLIFGYGELARGRPLGESGRSDWQHWLNAPAATLILTLTMWYALTVTSVAVGWAVLAMVLIEIGRTARRVDFRWQGHVLSAAVFVRVMIANLNATTEFGVVSIRLVTVLPLVVMFYYLFHVLNRDAVDGRLTTREHSLRIPELSSYFGLIALLALLRFEFAPEWVAVTWAAVALTLAALGRFSGLAVFRPQAIFSAILVLERCALENFTATTSGGWWNERTVTIAAVAVLFLGAYKASRPTRTSQTPSAEDSQRSSIRKIFDTCVAESRHFFFFSAAALVTALIWLDAAGGYLTAEWAIEGLGVFLFAIVAGERIYRLFGLAILLVCTVRVVTLDIWRLETLQRILALIVLGAALVLVSFFYTRYRDTWRKVLLGV